MSRLFTFPTTVRNLHGRSFPVERNMRGPFLSILLRCQKRGHRDKIRISQMNGTIGKDLFFNLGKKMKVLGRVVIQNRKPFHHVQDLNNGNATRHYSRAPQRRVVICSAAGRTILRPPNPRRATTGCSALERFDRRPKRHILWRQS